MAAGEVLVPLRNVAPYRRRGSRRGGMRCGHIAILARNCSLWDLHVPAVVIRSCATLRSRVVYPGHGLALRAWTGVRQRVGTTDSDLVGADNLSQPLTWCLIFHHRNSRAFDRAGPRSRRARAGHAPAQRQGAASRAVVSRRGERSGTEESCDTGPGQNTDVADIWRCLEITLAAGLGPADFAGGTQARKGRLDPGSIRSPTRTKNNSARWRAAPVRSSCERTHHESTRADQPRTQASATPPPSARHPQGGAGRPAVVRLARRATALGRPCQSARLAPRANFMRRLPPWPRPKPLSRQRRRAASENGTP